MNFFKKLFRNETYKISDWQIIGIALGATCFTVGVWELMKTYLPILVPHNAVYYPMEWVYYIVIIVVGIIILAWATSAFTKSNKGG